MKSVKAVIWASLTLLLLLFLFQNRDTLLANTTLQLTLIGPLQFRSTPIPLYALILGSLLLGVLFAALYCGLANLRLSKNLRSLRKQNLSLQEELKSLRNLPITDAEVPATRPADASGNESAEKAEEEKSGQNNVMDG
ncbi:MAG: LapA family protein [Deltaproteobacteria bacterium]|nr:MAG: LapA family protein [Deltaproteobacteria bacterium]